MDDMTNSSLVAWAKTMSTTSRLAQRRDSRTKVVRNKDAHETRKINPRIAPRHDQSLGHMVFCVARCGTMPRSKLSLSR